MFGSRLCSPPFAPELLQVLGCGCSGGVLFADVVCSCGFGSSYEVLAREVAVELLWSCLVDAQEGFLQEVGGFFPTCALG